MGIRKQELWFSADFYQELGTYESGYEMPADTAPISELTQEEKDEKSNTQKAIDEQRDKKNQLIADYAKGNSIVHQLIDLALLQNGMLKGAALDTFLKRSVELIK